MYVTYPGFETGRCSVSRLLSLPFGQADCFLLELQKGGSSPGYVLIDGGRKETQYPPLMDYLQKLGIPSIDLLILTHLHGDHLGWLDQVVLSVPVTEAVLPYGPLGLDSDYLEREGMEREFCQTVIATMMGQLDKRDRTCKSRPFHGRLQAAFKYIPAEQGRCLCPVIQQPDRTVTVEIPGCPAPGIPDSSRSALARAKTELFKSSCPMT